MPDQKQIQTPRKRRRWLKWTLAVLIVIILLIALAPTLLSSGPGTQFVLGQVNSRIAGALAMDDLSLGWFGGQSVVGLRLNGTDGETLLTVDRIEAPGLSLWSVLTGGDDFGEITLIAPNAAIRVINEQGETNLQWALTGPVEDQKSKKPRDKKTSAPSSSTLSADMSLVLKLTDGRIRYEPWEQPAVELSTLNAEINAANLRDISAEVAFAVVQDGRRGDFNGRIKLTDLCDARGVLSLDRLRINNAELSMTDLPSVMLAAMLSQNTRLATLFGQRLSGEVKADGQLHDLNAAVQLRGVSTARNGAGRSTEVELLNVNVQVEASDKSLAARTGSQIRLHVADQSWRTLTVDHPQLAQSKLLKPFDMVISLDRLHIPRVDGQLRYADGSIDLPISVSPIAVQSGDEQLGDIALSQVEAQISAGRIGEQLVCNLQANAMQKRGGVESVGLVELRAQLYNVLTREQAFNATGYSADIAAAVRQLPIVVVEQLAGLGGLLEPLLGSQLNAKLAVDWKSQGETADDAGRFELTINTDRLNWSASARQDKNRFVLESFDELALSLPVNWLEQVNKHNAALGSVLAGAALAPGAGATLKLTQLVVPLADHKAGGFDLGEVEIAGRASITNLVLQNHPRFAGVGVKQLTVDLPIAKLGQTIKLNTSGEGVMDGQATTWAGAVTMRNALTDQPKIDLAMTLKDLSVFAIARMAQLDDQLPAFLGERVEQIDITWAPDSANAAVGLFDVKLRSPNAKVVLAGRYDPAAGVGIDPVSRAELTLSPAQIASLQTADSAASLQTLGDLVLVLEVNEAQFAFDKDRHGALDPALSRMDLSIQSPGAAMRSAQAPRGFAIKNIKLIVQSDNLQKKLTLLADADYVLDSDDSSAAAAVGKLSSTTQLANLFNAHNELDSSGWRMETATTITRLPTALVDALAGQDGLLTALAGDTIDQLTLTLPPASNLNESLPWRAEVRSPNLAAQLSGQYAHGRSLAVDPGGRITLQLTPVAFEHLVYANADADADADATTFVALNADASKDAGPRIALTQTATIELKTSALMIALQPTDANAVEQSPTLLFDPAKTRVDVSMACPRLMLDAAISDFAGRVTKQTVELRNLLVAARGENLLQPFNVSVHGDFLTRSTNAPQAEKIGRIASTTAIRGLINPQGALQLAQAVYETDTHLQDTPIAPIDAMLNQKGALFALFGETLSLRLVGPISFSGEAQDVDISLSSGNLAAQKLALTVGDNLSLREDAKITLRVTPEIAELLLKYLNFVLRDAKASEHPITLTIARQVENKKRNIVRPFSFPLAAWSQAQTSEQQNAAIRAISADVDVELGKLQLDTKTNALFIGLADALAGNRRRAAKQADDGTEWVEFTPFHVSVFRGKVRTGEVWMIASDSVMGVQGVSDLITQRLDMFAAISGQSFMGVPGIGKLIREDGLLEIKVRGTIDKAKPEGLELVGNVLKNAGDRVSPLLGALIDDALKQLAPDRIQMDWRHHPVGVLRQRRKNDPNLPPEQSPEQSPAQQPAAEQPKRRRDEKPADPLEKLFGDVLREAIGDKEKQKQPKQATPEKQPRQKEEDPFGQLFGEIIREAVGQQPNNQPQEKKPKKKDNP